MTRLTARADRRLIRPTDRSHRFVLVELTAPSATRRRERAPVNLAFVLDRSGSMFSSRLTDRSSLTYADAAAIFGASARARAAQSPARAGPPVRAVLPLLAVDTLTVRPALCDPNVS